METKVLSNANTLASISKALLSDILLRDKNAVSCESAHEFEAIRFMTSDLSEKIGELESPLKGSDGESVVEVSMMEYSINHIYEKWYSDTTLDKTSDDIEKYRNDISNLLTEFEVLSSIC